MIVAIMVAGRSGSAYTAEGSMKMREEIDALSTMGVDPIDVLILPRIIALVLALPILAFIGSMAALYGGGLVAWFYGGMSPSKRFRGPGKMVSRPSLGGARRASGTHPPA